MCLHNTAFQTKHSQNGLKITLFLCQTQIFKSPAHLETDCICTVSINIFAQVFVGQAEEKQFFHYCDISIYSLLEYQASTAFILAPVVVWGVRAFGSHTQLHNGASWASFFLGGGRQLSWHNGSFFRIVNYGGNFLIKVGTFSGVRNLWL